MVVKYNYLNSKEGRRLDNLIHKLVVKSKDDVKRRFNKILCNSYSFRDKPVRGAHSRGLAIKAVDIITSAPRSWMVKSQGQAPGVGFNEYYSVDVVRDTCGEARCLTCRECKVCRHMVTCSCYDYSINDNICKHIHACISSNPNAVAPRRVDTELELAEMFKYFRTDAPDYKRNLAAEADAIVLAIQNETNPDRLEEFVIAFDSTGLGQGRSDPANKGVTAQRSGAKKRRLN